MSGARGPIRWTVARLHRRGAAPAVTAVVVAGLVALPATSAVFSSTTSNAANTLTAANLDTWLPTVAIATRTGSTRCLVSWTPAAGVPAGLSYDVSDGTSTVATGISTTSVTITVPARSVIPTVRTVLGDWHSASATIAAPCVAGPDAPGGLTMSPSDGQLAASWSAPAGNGSPILSYTATLSPGGATCTTTAPTTGCTFTGLTNGTAYTISVTATSADGAGPAATATAVPYPSTIMTTGRLALWLDGADPSTLYSSSGCTGPTVSTAGQSVGCWDDKSGSGNSVVQSTNAAQPVLAAVAGRPVPGFDGSASYLTAGIGSMPTGSTTSTTFLEATSSVSAPGIGLALAWGTNSTAASRQILRRGSMIEADDWGAAGAVSASVDPAPQVIAAEHAAAAVTLWHNGAPGVTTAATTSTGGTFLTVGRQGTNADYYWQGAIPEIIVFAGTLSDAERRAIEEYLARKWGSGITPPAPTGLSAHLSGASATVSWSAPAWDGDSALTGYTVTATGGAGPITCTAAAPATICTLNGLNASGTTYALTVTATNAVGTGPASSAATLSTGAPYAGYLKLWLAADDLDGDGTASGASESGLVGGAVQTWKDKSGHHYDVTAPAGQLPAYGTQTLESNSLVTFNGSTVLMGSGTDIYGITGDRTLFMVTRPRTVEIGTAAGGSFIADRNSATNNLFGLKVTTGGKWALQTRDDNFGGFAETAAAAGPVAGQTDILEAARSSTTNTFTVDGTLRTTGSVTGTMTQPTLSIGRHVYGSTTSDFDLAEVLLYDRALSAGEARTVEGYLTGKWGAMLVPAAPTAVTATRGDRTLAASWTAPSDVGSAAVSSYTATSSPGGFTCTSAATTCSIGGLTNGTAYTVTVTATNAAGTGAASAASAAVTPDVAPGAPTGVVAGPGDTSAALTWTAPASNGGTAVISYTATAVPRDNRLHTATCSDASTSCTLNGLVNGIDYTVTVTATNAAGTGAASTAGTVVAIPAVMASADLRGWLDAQNAASLNGSAGCTGSTVSTGSPVPCWTDRSGHGWNAVRGATSPVLTADAINGHQALRFIGADPDHYEITAAGVGAVGGSDRSIFAVGSLTTTGTANGSGTVVDWPSSDTGIFGLSSGGTTSISRVQAYAYRAGGSVSTTTAVTAGTPSVVSSVFSTSGGTIVGGIATDGADSLTSSTPVSGWWPAQADVLRIGAASALASPLDGDLGEILVFDRAVNATERRSIEEYLARRWGTPITPQAPATATAASFGTGSATVTFTAPAWDGGSGLTSYTVAPVSGTGSCTWTAGLAASCSGLTPGSPYTFTVRASNRAGAGPIVTTNTVTP